MVISHSSSARASLPLRDGAASGTAVVDGGRASALAVGAHITTLAGVHDGVGPAGLGRVGCFGVRRDVRQWSRPLLLTSQHVLVGYGASVGDHVFAPSVTPGTDPIEIVAAALEPVARVGEGHDGVHRFAFAGEPAADYHVDCAVAELTDHEALPVGDVVFRVGRTRPNDALPGRGLAVRLLGGPRAALGHVADTDATVERVDGTLCPRTIVIRSRHGRPTFATEGDSGALVVDRLGRAVGLLWGVDLSDPTTAYACHLQPALDVLGLMPSLRRGIATREEEP
jgi:hypothetical protein